VAAGPFDDKTPTISGVFFFKTKSIEEAKRVAAEDPTVVEHRNTVDVLAWHGPAGVGEEYKRLHKADPQTPEGMGVHPFYLVRRSDDSKAEMTNHAAYVAGLLSKGKLAAAGPVNGGGNVSEVLIFNRIPDEEAAQIVEEDPGVKAGILTVEPHRWWCSAHVLPR